VSGSDDGTIRVWDLTDKNPSWVLEGHTRWVNAVAISANGERAISGSWDKTVRVWDLNGSEPARILEGHITPIRAVAISANGERGATGSSGGTVRIWDIKDSPPTRVLAASSGIVFAVAICANGSRVVSGSKDRKVRVWDLDTPILEATSEERIRYTNAKVVLVGDSGSGKTGITVRLAQDLPPSRWPSTSGVWSTQWPLKDPPVQAGTEQELWLWDFGGQADQRLIHQLYLDRTAAVLLLFDGDKDTVMPGLREW
jgi:WD40 repeat protein